MRSANQKEMFEISDLRRREILHLRSVCPFFPQGVGRTLIFSYIRRLQLFFGVQNFEFHYPIFLGGGGYRNLNIFGGMKILLISILGHHKIGLY